MDQRGERVLAYIDEHGRITRGEAMALCNISLDQAKRLLRSLVSRRLISMHGDRRTAWYERAP